MASAGFEPVNLGTKGQYTNHKTTEATDIGLNNKNNNFKDCRVM
jgi:hypothetical protein